MDFKKAIRFEELKEFFEEREFIVEKDHGDYFFENKYKLHFSPHSNNVEPDKIYLDSNIESFGEQPLFRIWPKDGSIYDYLTKMCYPIMKNLRGIYCLSSEEIKNQVEIILIQKNITYSFFKDYEYYLVSYMPGGRVLKRTNKSDLYKIENNNKKYGISVGSNLRLFEFTNDSNEVLVENEWYKFSPTYLEGSECLETVIINMLNYIDKYNN